MSGWWLRCLLVICLFVVVNTREGIDPALTLAHCRASCIHEINMSKATQNMCQHSLDCSQCWDMCRLFQSAIHVDVFCANTHCTGGCLRACHWVSLRLPPPVLLTKSLEELTVTNHTASWPSPDTAAPVPVYVVMVDHRQYLQTLDLTAALPLAVDPLTVQVLVVDWRGMTEVFTLKPQSPLEQTRSLVRRLGIENTIGLGDSLRNGSRNQIIVKSPWNLRELSRTYQLDLVKVKISWSPQQSAVTTQLMYLVTWQEEGGVLRGNLLTNSSTVTLSLQTNTVFRIQVALFTLNSSDWESELLELNTHHSILLQSHLPSQSQPALLPTANNPQMAAYLAAGVATVLVVILVLTWRLQHGIPLPHSKLVDVEIGIPKMYRVFPPAIRLIGDNMDVKSDIFSSRDNLLQN